MGHKQRTLIRGNNLKGNKPPFLNILLSKYYFPRLIHDICWRYDYQIFRKKFKNRCLIITTENITWHGWSICQHNYWEVILEAILSMRSKFSFSTCKYICRYNLWILLPKIKVFFLESPIHMLILFRVRDVDINIFLFFDIIIFSVSWKKCF